uniref:Uncharacterized protein n=1 Tax=Anguilla anguilla TaxID=7936 RepID=A0A0E9XYK2_ANGAN
MNTKTICKLKTSHIIVLDIPIELKQFVFIFYSH